MTVASDARLSSLDRMLDDSQVGDDLRHRYVRGG